MSETEYNHPLSFTSECESIEASAVEILFSCERISGRLYVMVDFAGFPEHRWMVATVSESRLLSSADLQPGVLLHQESQIVESVPDSVPVYELLSGLPGLLRERIEREIRSTISQPLETEIAHVQSEHFDHRPQMQLLKITHLSEILFPDLSERYRLLIDGQEYRIEITYPEEMLKEYFILHRLKLVSDLISERRFSESLLLLDESNRLLPSADFTGNAREVLTAWGGEVYRQRPTLDSLFEEIERVEILSGDKDWIATYRIELFHRHLIHAEERGASLDYLLEGYESLILWSDRSLPFRIKAYELRSLMAEQSGNYWQALRYFQRAVDLSPEITQRTSRKRSLLEAGFESEMVSELPDMELLFYFGSRYHHYIEENGVARYLYSSAARELVRPDIWAQELEWLLANISAVSHLTTRNELQLQLNEAYQAGLRFEDAYTFNRRLFMESGDHRQLNNFILNLRAAAIVPLFYLLSDLNPDKELFQTLWNERIHFYIEPYLQAIWLQHSDGEVRFLYNRSENHSSHPVQHSLLVEFPYFFLDDEAETAWFTVPHETSHLVIEISARHTEADHAGIHSIMQTPDLPSSWQQVIHSNQLAAAVATVTVLAAIFEMEAPENPSLLQDSLKKRLDSLSSVRYLLLEGGERIESMVFIEPEPELLLLTEWDTPYRKELIFYQYLTNAQERILDVSNSLFDEDGVTGHLRIGIRSVQ